MLLCLTLLWNPLVIWCLLLFQGFTLEDATGLAIKGDVDVHSVHATSLPTSHPSFSPQRVLSFSEEWKSHPLPHHGIQLFIGVLSANNHFAERMAVRKTWMQSLAVRSSNVVVRFFVALVSFLNFLLHLIYPIESSCIGAFQKKACFYQIEEQSDTNLLI